MNESLEDRVRDMFVDALAALLEDKPAANGEYVHIVWCNGNRTEPVGGDGCSCPIGLRIKAIKAGRP